MQKVHELTPRYVRKCSMHVPTFYLVSTIITKSLTHEQNAKKGSQFMKFAI